MMKLIKKVNVLNEHLSFVKCMRIKIEQKDSVVIDFTNKLELIAFSDSPFEIFMTLVSALYKKLYLKLYNFNGNVFLQV